MISREGTKSTIRPLSTAGYRVRSEVIRATRGGHCVLRRASLFLTSTVPTCERPFDPNARLPARVGNVLVLNACGRSLSTRRILSLSSLRSSSCLSWPTVVRECIAHRRFSQLYSMTLPNLVD
jgi:hypothetical protein